MSEPSCARTDQLRSPWQEMGNAHHGRRAKAAGTAENEVAINANG